MPAVPASALAMDGVDRTDAALAIGDRSSTASAHCSTELPTNVGRPFLSRNADTVAALRG